MQKVSKHYSNPFEGLFPNVEPLVLLLKLKELFDKHHLHSNRGDQIEILFRTYAEEAIKKYGVTKAFSKTLDAIALVDEKYDEQKRV